MKMHQFLYFITIEIITTIGKRGIVLVHGDILMTEKTGCIMKAFDQL